MPHVSSVKVTVPETPPDLVDRPALRTRLDRATGTTLLCAPAGYGKTLLLADWARRCAPEDTAWVRVDRDDNDPARFWAAVADAITSCRPHLHPPTVRRPGAQADYLAHLGDALRSRDRPVRLVLDDLHELVDPGVLHGVADLTQNTPPGLQLLLSSRLDPPLSLARLGLTGHLTELRAAQLRFSATESAALLTTAHPQLSTDEVDLLHRRTGGWPAGLRLAVLGLAGTADPAGFLAGFSGDERSVADYLVEEVLSTLREDILDMLRAISVCDPVPADLAVVLSGREDAGALLDHLEHRTSLVWRVGNGHQTYRIQELLRTYLLADVRRQGPTRAAQLQATAARWWAGRGEPVPALEHAARSGDSVLLTDTIRRSIVPLMLTGDHASLRRALTRVGPRATAADPWLALSSALTHLEAGERPATRQDLQDARRNWPARPAAGLTVLRTLAEQWSEGPAAAAAARAVALEPGGESPREPELEALDRLGRGAARLAGHDDGARVELEAALELARRHGFDYLRMQCVTLLGAAAGATGDLRAVRALSAQSLDCAGEHGWAATTWSVAAAAMHAYTSLLRTEYADAEHRTAQALALAPAVTPPLLFALRAVHGAARFDGGARADGLTELQEARLALGDVAVAPAQAAAAAMLEFRAALLLGHVTAARAVLGWLAARTGENAEVLVARARAEAAAGRPGPAREMLRPVLEAVTPSLLSTTAVEAWLLETSLAAGAGMRPDARRALRTALALGEPLDALRPFAQAGSAVRTLLMQQQGTFGRSDSFADRALRAGSGTPDDPTALLSRREVAVLAMLPSLLSLEEIATDLTVSVNTVKSHVRSIYAKLGVSSRRLAVLTAHERGLLSVGGPPV